VNGRTDLQVLMDQSYDRLRTVLKRRFDIDEAEDCRSVILAVFKSWEEYIARPRLRWRAHAPDLYEAIEQLTLPRARDARSQSTIKKTTEQPEPQIPATPPPAEPRKTERY